MGSDRVSGTVEFMHVCPNGESGHLVKITADGNECLHCKVGL